MKLTFHHDGGNEHYHTDSGERVSRKIGDHIARLENTVEKLHRALEQIAMTTTVRYGLAGFVYNQCRNAVENTGGKWNIEI